MRPSLKNFPGQFSLLKAGLYLLFAVSILAMSLSTPHTALARPLADAVPGVSVNIPSPVMLGEDFNFTVTFENTGLDPGYGPFVDLVFPLTGEDGDDGIDYYSASYLGSALVDDVQIFPGVPDTTGCVSHPWLRDTSGAYVDVCGNAGDKFVSLKLPFGSYVPGQPGLDIAVNAHLNNYADLTPNLSIYARGGYMFGETPEDDWCCGDAPIPFPSETISTNWPATPVTPQLMTFTKEYIGPGNTQDETSTGPNFPRQYTLTVEIADGQTLTDLDIQDLLPDNLQYIGIGLANTTAGYTVTSSPSTTEPGGTLTVNYASATGTVMVTYDFYIPELYDSTGGTTYDDPVINPISGDDVDSENIAWADGSWDPADSRDPITPVSSDPTCPTCTPLHTLQDKSIAIQKNVSVVPGTGGGPADDQPAPGAILEYSLEFQVSDYFSFENLVITDTISDGQHLLSTSGTPNFTPTIEVNGNPYYLGTASFNSSNYIVSCDYTGATTTPPSECTVVSGGTTGDTTLTFNISDEIITRLENGRMLGGCVNPGGGLFTPCVPVTPPATPGDGPTTATIVFQTQILEEFVNDFPSGDQSVDQGDELGNTADITGDVLENSTFTVVGTEDDDAAIGVSIGRETLSKTIYAINNEDDDTVWDRDALGRVRIKPGDKITYRLTYGLFTSDVEELTFDDYFPLPVFNVDDPDEDGSPGPAWSFSDLGGIPAPGVVTLMLPGDTFYQYMTDGLSGSTGILSPSANNNGPTQAPVIIADNAANKLNIYYADYDDTRNQSTTVDLLFSLVVSDDPFADGLYLTNMAHAFEGSTNAGTSSSDAIIQFVLGEPVLVSQKGIVWTSNSNAAFNPTDIGPAGVTFQTPPNQPRWTGTISSDGLASNPIDSNITGVDAGDTLTFAISIENQGSSINGAFDIQLRDIIDMAYYLTPTTGADLNLQIYYGADGTVPPPPSGPIPYQAIDGSCSASGDGDICGLELFDEGIELVDPVGEGVCQTHDPNAGNNVILITYDLEIKPDVIPGQAVNTVSLMNYAGSEGGPNHLPEDQKDDATADVVGELEKTLENTEIISGTNELDEVVIGELVTYKISAVIPEGEVPNAHLVDHLDGGLAFVSCTSVIAYSDTAVTTDVTTDLLSGSDFSGVCGTTEASGVTNFGQDIIFDLGNITNSNRDNSDQERVEIIYQVVVLNVSGNQASTILDNAAEFLMNDGSGDASLGTADAEDVTVIEPVINTTKVSSISTGDAGNAFTYTITLTNPSSENDTDAFDADFADNFPICPVATDGSAVIDLTLNSQSGPATFVLSGDNTNGWVLDASGFDMAPGETATVEIGGEISYCVNPGNSLDNTGTTTWTSLSGDYTTPDGTIPVPRSDFNLNSVERTGADGVGGALNDYASADTASIVIDNPANSKYIIDTSELHTGYVNSRDNVAIGEIIRYRIVSSIPEGTSPNFQVRDLLPGGLIFLNDDTAVVAFVSDDGITSTGIGIVPPIPDSTNPPGCNYPGSTADNTTPVLDPVNCTLADNNIGSTALTGVNEDNYISGIDPYFKLGQLVNNDSDIDFEYVVIEFNALVHNSATSQNDGGDTRTNSARVYINGSQNGDDSNGVTVRVAEPIITVNKTIIPPVPNDAGDDIEYEIVFSNSSILARKATAFDLVLSDTFDPYLENLSVTSVTSSQGDWTNPAVICDGDGDGTTDFDLTESLVGHTLTVNVSCLDPGESVTLRITGNVVDGVPASTTLYNTAIGTGTSLPGDNGTTSNPTGSVTPGASGTDTGERDGSDTDTGGQDDLYDSDDADLILAAPGISKTVEAPAQWTIGETFTYDLVVTLPEGVTPDMVVYDDIPVGLEWIGYSVLTSAASPGSLLLEDYDGVLSVPTANPPTGSGGDLILTFGDTTTNEDDPDDPDDNSFQVRVYVRMLNVIENQNGDILTNQSQLQYSGGTAATDTVDVEVLEPVLEVEKTTNPDPAVDLDAGDTVQYSLTISHDLDGVGEDSQSDAFDVSLDDLLDGGSGNILIASIDSTILTGGATEDTAAAITGGGTGISGQYDIPMGDTVTVIYTAELQESIRPDQTLANDVEITWSSLQDNPDEARDGSGGVDDYLNGTSVNVDTRDLLSITKEVIDSNQTHTSGNELTIGEEVTYRMVVTVIEGTTNTVVVTDTLPDNLNFIPGTVVVTPNGPGMTTGYTAPPAWADPVLTIDLGQVINPADNNIINDTITIVFEALVENDSVNQNENTKTNNVQVTDRNLTDTASADVDIVEPVLDVTKSVDNSTPALGQTITYTLVIAHDLDGSGEDSQADAFDINLVDTLPTGLSNLANINITTNPVSCATGIDGSASTTSELNVSIDSIPHQLPAPGCEVTITFDATVDTLPSPTTPTVGSTIDNTGSITWTSIDGSDGNERFGDGIVGGLNDYENDDTETITITNPDLRVTKDDGVAFYVPGLTVVYDIVVENVGNEDVIAALVEDAIPPQLSSWDWACNGTTGGASGCDGVAGSSVNFSDFVDLPAGSSLTYQVTANILSSATGLMTNTVTVTMPAGYIEPTPDDNTDSDTDTQESQADLSVSKDDGVTLISPGTTITYTIVVSNLSPSDVWGADVTDSIPAEIDSWTWACTGTTGGASGCTPAPNSALDFSDTVDLPASSSITYSVTAQVSAAASGTLTNLVTVTAPAGVTETNLDNNTDNDVDGFPENSKDLVDQLHGVTTLPDVAIGEVLTYEVVLTVPVGSMANLHLVDTLDRGLAFVTCDVINGPGLTTNGSVSFSAVCASPAISTYPSGSTDDEDLGRQVDFNFGTLANNGDEPTDLTVRYQVVVLDSLENQGSGSTPPLNNQAEWTWDSGQFSDQAVGVLIQEPDLTLTKDVDSNVAYPGQLLTFTLVIDHSLASETSAFDLELTDIIPDGLIYQPPIRYIAGQAPDQIIDAGAPTLIIRWLEFENLGVNSVLEIDVLLDSDFRLTKHNQSITNEASLSWTSLPGDFSNAQSIHNPLSTERYYDPLSNVNIYGTGDSARILIPALPDTGFAPGKVTPLPIQSDNQTYGDLGGLQIEVPKLDLSVPIVSVPQSEKGWDLTWLWNQAGWLEGTAYPSWYGNTVITGHAYLPNGLPGPFVDLETLSWGDEIILYAHGLKYTYKVRVKDLVSADDLSILEHKDQDWLTLFTCKEYSEILDEYLWRQVVQAVLIDVEQID